jgi:hypothetical protein
MENNTLDKLEDLKSMTSFMFEVAQMYQEHTEESQSAFSHNESIIGYRLVSDIILNEFDAIKKQLRQ